MKKKKNVVALVRHSHVNDCDTLMRAFAQLANRYLNWQLNFMEKENKEKSLKK